MTSMRTTLYLGPIQAIGYNIEPSWGSSVSPQGNRSFSLDATLPLAAAEQLSELVANRDRRITAGPDTGVLEYVYMDGGVARDFNGWCLFQQADFKPYRIGDSVQYANVSLSAVHLGPNRQVVVTRSDRDLDDFYGRTAVPIVADPFYGGSFVASPGGTKVQRAYDPLQHDSARVVPPVAVMDTYRNPTASIIQLAPAT